MAGPWQGEHPGRPVFWDDANILCLCVSSASNFNPLPVRACGFYLNGKANRAGTGLPATHAGSEEACRCPRLKNERREAAGGTASPGRPVLRSEKACSTTRGGLRTRSCNRSFKQSLRLSHKPQHGVSEVTTSTVSVAGSPAADENESRTRRIALGLWGSDPLPPRLAVQSPPPPPRERGVKEEDTGLAK